MIVTYAEPERVCYPELSWETIFLLIKEENSLAKKIKGRWESLAYLIDEWFLEKIKKGTN